MVKKRDMSYGRRAQRGILKGVSIRLKYDVDGQFVKWTNLSGTYIYRRGNSPAPDPEIFGVWYTAATGLK